MKKVLLLAAVCLLMGTTVKAQSPLGWSFGVKGGLNLANLTDDANEKIKPSFHLGLFAEYRINDFFGIQPEFTYSRQGSFAKEGDVKEWLRFNYFNVPVLAKLYVFEKLSINLGPQFGILLNSKWKQKDGSTKITETVSGGKGMEVSFAMGLSYNLNYNWMIDARYNLGLTDVNKHADAKNSVFQLGLAYRF